jgi:putative ABC transport system permease protein
MAAGRGFTEQDSENSPRVAIVNEAFAKKYLSGIDPLQQRLLIERVLPGQGKIESAVEWQIVGVSRNIRNGDIHGDGFPEIAVPFAQSPWPEANIVVRTARDPGAMNRMLANAVHSVNAKVALQQVRTMDDIVDESLVTDRFATSLFGGFAAVALLLAAVGIYGVMAFAVAQRTHELGLRIALGARHDDVIHLVLREGLALAGVGLVIGLFGAYAAGRALGGLLYGVGSLDVPAIAAVAITLLTAALVACYIPARRAAGVDPMTALRYE